MREWYDKVKKSLIDPKLFALKDLNSVRFAIIVFVKRAYDWMKVSLNNILLERSEGLVGAHSFFATEDGFAVFYSYFGAPAAVELAETLIAGGVKSLIIFGEAGAISPKINLGETLIPTFAVREEGTSYHYLPPGVAAKPSLRLRMKIKSLLDRLGMLYKEGGVWTTDAPFRETYSKVLRYSSQGIFAVDMECSALFSVAKYRRAKAAALLIITDTLHQKGWKPAFNDKNVIKNEKKISENLIKYWRELSF